MPRKLNGPRNVLRCRWRELQELSAWSFEREAMLVFPARRIRSQCGNADAVFAFNGLCIPQARRAISFWSHPPLDVPTIDRWILRLLPQFDDFSEKRTRRGIVLLEFAANPREPVPSPNGTIIRLTETVDASRAAQKLRDRHWRLMRFAKDKDPLRRVIAAACRVTSSEQLCRGTIYRAPTVA